MKLVDSWKAILTMLEMKKEREDLQNLGLLEEEVDGYFEFYSDNYTKDLKVIQE